jgi:hypothetical protein
MAQKKSYPFRKTGVKMQKYYNKTNMKLKNMG